MPLKARSGLALAASGTDAKKTFDDSVLTVTHYKDDKDFFLKSMNIISNSVTITKDDYISTYEAEIISIALSHKPRESEKMRLGGIYFTDKQWSVATEKKIGELQAQLTQALTSSQQEASKEEIYTCECLAHLYNDEAFYSDFIVPLTELSPPLDVNTGLVFGNKILSLIIQRANLPVTYQLIGGRNNGDTETYTGWADFIGFQTFTRQQRKLGHSSTTMDHTRFSGEMQSTDRKYSSFTQAGIYAVGYLAKCNVLTTTGKLASVVFYRDMSASVCLAELFHEKKKMNIHGSVGKIQYQLVDSPMPYSLTNVKELQRFAKVLVSTVELTITL